LNNFKSYGVKFNVDKNDETIYSDAWGIIRSYNKEDLKKMCEEARFKVIQIVDLGEIAFGIELEKQSSL
jgi:hypothetical protein